MINTLKALGFCPEPLENDAGAIKVERAALPALWISRKTDGYIRARAPESPPRSWMLKGHLDEFGTPPVAGKEVAA